MLPIRIFRALLWCFPTPFREEYGAEMARTFLQDLREAHRQNGWLAEAVIWCLEGNFAGRGFYERCGGRRLSESGLEDVAGMPLPTIGYHWML